MALTILFADTFLEGARIAPRLSRAIQFLAFLLLLEVPLCALDTPIKYYVIHISGLVGITATGFLAGYAIRAGYAPARPFLRALAPTALGVVILSLLGPGLLPTTTFTEYGVELCFMLTGALWLQSLTSRLRNQEAEHRETLEVRVSERTADLSKALAEVKTLSGLLPMCSGCKKIRDDKGYWNGVEAYIEDRSDAMFSHGLCPDCVHEFFSEYFDPDEKIDG